jgi:hypothetical protein
VVEKMMTGISTFGEQLEIGLQDVQVETRVMIVLSCVTVQVKTRVKHGLMCAVPQANTVTIAI